MSASVVAVVGGWLYESVNWRPRCGATQGDIPCTDSKWSFCFLEVASHALLQFLIILCWGKPKLDIWLAQDVLRFWPTAASPEARDASAGGKPREEAYNGASQPSLNWLGARDIRMMVELV
eukprot:224117-Amphidinium_carterae.1